MVFEKTITIPTSQPIPPGLSSKMPVFPADDRPSDELHDLEYGKLESRDHLYTSNYPAGQPLPDLVDDDPSYVVYILTYLNYLILIIIGHVEDFFGKIFCPKDFEDLIEKDGYSPWYDGFEQFYVRRLKMRLDDCFARPVHGTPGRFVKCINRVRYGKTYLYDGTVTECLNLSSYNYLGFGQSKGICSEFASKSVDEYGVSGCSPRSIIGTTDLHKQCERVVANFVGKEDALIVSQGFGTNANLFSSIADSKTLVISDELNHASIRLGIRQSGASVKVFKHNDVNDLEKLVRNQIAQGQPKTHRPWSKIIIAVEGLYSMEGNMCNLPKLIEIKKKYKCYLFVDEAHSIGALGKDGKGICNYFSVDPADVDILMGTFTKSFGATGGYFAADKGIIDRLRLTYLTNVYAESVPPPVLSQIISSLSIIEGNLNPGEGQERLQRIAFNARYLRLALKKLGFIVYGADDSPVIPLLIFFPAKMADISRTLYDRGIAVVVVSYPATPLDTARARFCVSSALTKSDLDYVITQINDIAPFLKLSSGNAGGSKTPGIPPRWSLKEVIETTVEDVKKPKLG